MRTTQPHIAIDCRMLGMSGIGVYLENIVSRLPALLPDCTLTLLGAMPRLQALKLPASVRLIACDVPIYSIREQIAVFWAAHAAHLLWIPHYNIPLFSTVPLLVTVHDLAPLVLPEIRSNWVRKIYACLLFSGVRLRAKEIVCVSRFTAGEFAERVGVPRCPVHVVYNGVDNAWFAHDSKTFSPHVKPYFVAVGNVKKHKRVDMLCRAFTSVQDQIPHDLILIGKSDGFISGGQSIQGLLSLAPGRIHCTGLIDDAQLKSYVRHAVALIMPSAYEGFGLPPLEAMAMGTPVIASDIPPVREVCGDIAQYFALDDVAQLAQRLLYAANNTNELQCKRADAVARARSFSWEKAAAHYASILRSLVK